MEVLIQDKDERGNHTIVIISGQNDSLVQGKNVQRMNHVAWS